MQNKGNHPNFFGELADKGSPISSNSLPRAVIYPVGGLLAPPPPAGGVDPVHDRAGNMTKMPQPQAGASAYAASYDGWNRLVKLTDGVNTVAEYQYDARGRRIVKKSYTSGTLSETRHFYYTNNWQVLEERIGTSTNANTQYVWGLNYVDEMVCRDRDANGGTSGDGTLEQTHYVVQDANFNVTALINTSGSVAERYRYTPYGQRTVLDDNFALDSDGMSDVAFVHGHQGLRHDADSNLVENRNRVLHVTLGRFVQRDPLRYVDGMNLYQYERSLPSSLTDSTGLWTVHISIWMERANRPKNFDLAKVASILKRDVAASIKPIKGNKLVVTLRDRSGPPSQLGWKYNIPGGSMNAGFWDYVPVINFFTKGYRACFKRKISFDGYVKFGSAGGAIAFTGSESTVINAAKTDSAYESVSPSTPIDQLYSNIIAHEQLHLAAYGGFDWLNAPDGHIASETASAGASFTVAYKSWAKKFLKHADLHY